MVRLRCWAVINDRLRGLTAEDHARRSPAPAHQHQRTKAPKAAPRHPGTSARPTPRRVRCHEAPEHSSACGASGCSLAGQMAQPCAKSAVHSRFVQCPHRYNSPCRSTRDCSDRRPAPVTHLVHLRSPSLDGSCHSGRRRSGSGFRVSPSSGTSSDAPRRGAGPVRLTSHGLSLHPEPSCGVCVADCTSRLRTRPAGSDGSDLCAGIVLGHSRHAAPLRPGR